MGDNAGIPAGWYADPEYVGQQRFWNGELWTDDRQPAAASVPPPPPGRLGSPPHVPVGPRPATSDNAGVALAVSIIGLLFCQFLSPVGMVMGRNELNRIDAGESHPDARGMAQAASIIGLIGTVILVLAVIMIIIFAVIIITAGGS